MDIYCQSLKPMSPTPALHRVVLIDNYYQAVDWTAGFQFPAGVESSVFVSAPRQLWAWLSLLFSEYWGGGS
jgi:hypothetical protein